MPPQIGNFVSKTVYGDKLKSDPNHPVQGDVLACRFVDAGGKERKSGDSYEVIQLLSFLPLLMGFRIKLNVISSSSLFSSCKSRTSPTESSHHTLVNAN
jgi:regulator of nonsense transcripts 1